MSDLVGNPEDRFSHNEAHIMAVVVTCKFDEDPNKMKREVTTFSSMQVNGNFILP